MSYEERFRELVSRRGPDECWPFTGRKHPRGYGAFFAGNRDMPAHRFAYELAHGPVPAGLDVDHTCHNHSDCVGGSSCEHRRCVNPAHLEAVPPVINRRRSHLHGAAKTHCKYGHEYTEENTIYKKASYGLARTCRECARERDRRRVPRRPAAPRRPRPECGTDSAYLVHLRLGEETCQPCRDAHAAHTRARMKRGCSR